LIQNITNSTGGEEEDDYEKLKNIKLSPQEKKRLKREAKKHVQVNFEYSIAELGEEDTIDTNLRIAELDEQRFATDTPAENRYDNLIHFVAKGLTYWVFTQNNERIVLFEKKKDRIDVLDHF